MQFHSLEDIFEAFNHLKVLIIGDVMVDSYLWGKVDRISPEAPVPIVHVQQREKRLGGASNVAVNVQAMGATPLLCSVIGTDADGQDLLNLLQKNNLSTEGIIQSKNRTTTTKHRIISGSQHLLRIDSEVDFPINADERKGLAAKIIQLALQCQAIIFEDYDKGVISKELIEEVVAFARKHNIPTIVDPKKRNFLNYTGVTLFKPNLKELREGLKIDFDSAQPEQLQQAVSLLKEQLQLTSALVTLSEKGVYIDFAGEKHLIPAHVRQIADVSGAGDTVVSIAALCLALQLSPRFIAGLANLGGGLVCEHLGAVPINKLHLLKEALGNNLFSPYAAVDY
jgi:D-glycero-beta-D-manno-heptose-7-phosphate kinase